MIVLKQNSLPNKILHYIYQYGRGKSAVIHLQQAPQYFGCTPYQCSKVLSFLKANGMIRRFNSQGREHVDYTVRELLLSRLSIAADHTLPWTKRSRSAMAAKWGVTVRAVQQAAWSLADEGIVFLGGLRRHMYLVLIADTDGFRLCPPTYKVSDSSVWYCRYVSGYHKPKPPKTPKWTVTAKLLDLLVRNEGRVEMTTTELAKACHCSNVSIKLRCRELRDRGIIARNQSLLVLLDPNAAFLFLQPWYADNANKNSGKTYPSIPSVIDSNKNKSPRITEVTVVTSLSGPTKHLKPTTVAAIRLLCMLKLKKAYDFQTGQALRRSWYPKNYAAGRRKLQMRRDEYRIEAEAQEEEYKLLQGRAYGKQRQMVRTAYEAIQECFNIPGAITDELITVGCQRHRSMLPTVETPDQNKLEVLVDWVCNEMQADEIAMDFWDRYREAAGIDTLPEMVMRFGLDMLLHIYTWSQLTADPEQQRYGFHILCYLTHIENHPYDKNHAERFVEPLSHMLDTAQHLGSFYACQVIGDALIQYIGLDWKLGSLNRHAPAIASALTEPFAIRGPNGESMIVTAHATVLSYLSRCGQNDTIEQLQEWVDDYVQTARFHAPPHKPKKWTADWYYQMAVEADKYGLPGDADTLRQKAAALNRWHTLSPEKQHSIVGLLNKPTRYDDPRLNRKQWAAIAEMKGVSNDLPELTNAQRAIIVERAFADLNQRIASGEQGPHKLEFEKIAKQVIEETAGTPLAIPDKEDYDDYEYVSEYDENDGWMSDWSEF